MKLIKFLGVIPLALAGCVSHREPVGYTTTVTTTPDRPTVRVYSDATPTLPPTSDRPVVRVYPDTSNTVRIEPPLNPPAGGVPSSDMAIAESIRSMLENDRALAYAARNVHFVVDNGQVSMTGNVLTESDRWQIHNDLSRMIGVNHV